MIVFVSFILPVLFPSLSKIKKSSNFFGGMLCLFSAGVILFLSWFSFIYFNRNANTLIAVRGKNKWPGMHQVWRTKFTLTKVRYVIGMDFVHLLDLISLFKHLLSQLSCYK